MSHAIIALWSHPRSMSTAFERIMRARGDLECLHEPFMYDYYINRSKREMPHFDAMDNHPRSYEGIRDMILAKAEAGPVFFKDMSYYVMPHIMQDEAFLRRVTHSFLVRNPKASLTSYAKLDPEFTSEELGIEAQWQQLSGLSGRGVVIQSERVQVDPQGEMRRYWQAVGLADKPEALEWGDEKPADWQQVAGWHQDVLSSKGVKPLTAEKLREIDDGFEKLVESQPRFKAMFEQHLPAYEKLVAQSER
ncbi:hypothetical protein [Aestuariivirga litoralis]|uniref:sulfotransferase-like domain-containing protein n=1 Tax=Aestuariivirga litoralis TaxID=2650924 RepID=UPI0018C5ED9F|nr:hypothetical protein [Aestuariivirga litoralis]MBG1232583.1 hypothetical protein [Aestuariivirga litoralis]